MPDLFVEVDSSLELMFSAIIELRKKDPGHELLQYWAPGGERVCENWPGFVQRFWDHERGAPEQQKNGVVQLVAFTRYYFAIQEALKT